ncbi:hypothetical protein [Vibrio nigripulchritudo]|uniref:hypothetical protein n=1 Tax=Vibrio nigripulchritudo TaxID=28173 RepID=UPI00249254F2|nr:hypothetical protein [Vibrio nigripulchritudo]BDU46890.1 hypothetical protein TUMSATVNIG3_56880 [Vibrio nigripulchritudo]
MKKIVENIANNAKELEQYSQSDIKLPSLIPQGFLSQFTKPFTKVQNWAKSVTEFTQSCYQNINNLNLEIGEQNTRIQELEQRIANQEQDFAEKLRKFVEANR